MSDLLAARAQMGTSLAFHIIFASLGVGLPLLLCLAEGLALWRTDTTWMTLTRRWTKAFALLFAIGMALLLPSLWFLFHVFRGKHPAPNVQEQAAEPVSTQR
jgi:cytochrome bd-type quinol oxidase subunit 1